MNTCRNPMMGVLIYWILVHGSFACSGSSNHSSDESQDQDAADAADGFAQDQDASMFNDGGSDSPDGNDLASDPGSPDADAAGDGSDAGDGQDAGGDTGPAVGKVLWTYDHYLQVEFGPAIGTNDLLFLQGKKVTSTPDGTPTLVALDALGRLQWSANTDPGIVPATPVTAASDRVIAAGSFFYDGNIFKTHVFQFQNDGTALATLAVTGSVIQASALTKAGLLVVPADPVAAFNGDAAAWTTPFPMLNGCITGTNVAVGPSGTLYVAERGVNAKYLYAIDPNSGAEKWHRDIGDASISPLAVDRDEYIYVQNFPGLLQVLDQNGTLIWSFQAIASGSGLVVGPDKTVYFGVINGGNFYDDALFAVRQGSNGQGEQVWSVNLGFIIGSTPALSEGGTLYAGNLCNTFAAVQASDGRVLWTYDTPAPENGCGDGWSSATIGVDGTVYASGGGALTPRALYAFEGDGTPLSYSAHWPGEQHDIMHTGSMEP